MKISILIIPLEGNRFQARAGDPFASSAEGATREEAVQKLKEQIARCFRPGVEVLQVELPENGHPLKPFAGTLRDDQLFADWQAAIAERRRELDADDSAP
jgi:predicted RNase H-like HicB family nuclease